MADMIKNIIKNTTLQDGFTVTAPLKRDDEFAKHWQIEAQKEGDLQKLFLGIMETTKNKAQAKVLSLNTEKCTGWVRLYQPVTAEGLLFRKKMDMSIEVQTAGRQRGVEWVALLKETPDGKRIFHTLFTDGFESQATWKKYAFSNVISNHEHGAKYYLVICVAPGVAGINLCNVRLHAAALQDAVPYKRGAVTAAPEPVITARKTIRNLLPQAPMQDKGNKPRIGVVGWELSHNPVGRSYLVAEILHQEYDVELLGPIFPFYGKELWPPLQGSVVLPVHSFIANNLEDFIRQAIVMVKAHPYDVVHVCKPRLSSMLIGLLYKLIWNIPVIADVDDYELSFFNTEKGYDFYELLTHLKPEDWKQPYTETWSRYADSMMDIADAVTVSNPTLMRLFGGVIVRHARDESVFNPSLYNREKTRSEFGFKPGDKVIVFLGTPRPHKGIYTIPDALEEIKDPDAVFCVIGTIRDKRVSNAFAKYKHARIAMFEDQPFSRIAELINMADLVCILQDPASAIAQHQIPAKLTDAMAMGVPVLATPVPPLVDLIAAQAVIGVEQEAFVEVLRDLLEDPARLKRQGEMGRQFYMTDFSYQVNVPRLRIAVENALRDKKPAPAIYRDLLDLIHSSLPGAIDRATYEQLVSALPARKLGPVRNTKEGLNVVYFWKQNDSGIYGRRQEMIAKYMLSSGRVKQVLHFDAPIGLKKLMDTVQADAAAKYKQGNLVVMNTIQRFLKIQDEPGFLKRTFIYDDGGGSHFLGQTLPKLSEFPEFVMHCMREAGIEDNAVAVVCPVMFEFPAVQDHVRFPCVIADVIDNHLAWPLKPEYEKRVRMNYEYILKYADLAFANCEAVQKAMQPMVKRIDLVPNGAELLDENRAWPEPASLKGLPRPVIGYVGNLSDRVRFDLISKTAQAHPEWSIVLIGSAHLNDEVLRLQEYPNITLLGVVPYEKAVEHIAHFDVAMIPHENGKLTEAMNPLKLYVYSAVGVPVVSTRIPNINDFEQSLYIGQDDDDFIAKIEAALEDRKKGAFRRMDAQSLYPFSWQKRVKDIFAALDDVLTGERHTIPAQESEAA